MLLTLLTAGIAAVSVNGCSAILKRPLDDEARQSAPGKFIQLSRGVVHYELAGHETGPTVVLIHGLATPSFVWDRNFSVLADAGFRVLRYDHLGRGFSDRPDTTYDRDLLDQQLFELLRRLEVARPVHLVGLSMGGAVAVTFTHRHPELVSTLTLIAPAGFPIKQPFALSVAKLPILGELLIAMVGDAVVLDDVKECFTEPEKFPEYEKKFKVAMQYQGFHRALLSTLRHMEMFNMAETYHRVGGQKKPVLLFWGRKDKVLPFETSEKVREAIPHADFRALDGAGHNLNYEFPDLVNPVLIEFLQKKR